MFVIPCNLSSDIKLTSGSHDLCFNLIYMGFSERQLYTSVTLPQDPFCGISLNWITPIVVCLGFIWVETVRMTWY